MGRSLRGKIALPGDKSISHRALMLAGISEGKSSISNLARSLDIESTVGCLESLGVEIDLFDNNCAVQGRGFKNFETPTSTLDCGNSGTTLRLLMGLLSASIVTCVLTGDDSLRRRPIGRVISPLERMGAVIESLGDNDGCPVRVRGTQLSGTIQTLAVPSAQVKTAILLAGLLAQGETELAEPVKTRDHTERILAHLGVDIKTEDNRIRLRPPERIKSFDITIPSDPSSAAFPIVGALLMPESELTLTDTLLNPTRTGFLQILRDMNTDIRFANTRMCCNESIADIHVRSSRLRSVYVAADKAPSYIDEVPILSLAASQASGKSRFCGLGELRVKESDRLINTTAILNQMGVKAIVEGDDLYIEGPAILKRYDGARVADHRLAMMIEIANLVCDGDMDYNYSHEIGVSFSEFYEKINEVLV